MMWWHGASGWDWWWMSLMMVAFWGVVAFAVVAVLRGSRHETHHETPDEILARRFARGEITKDQFEESKRLLAG